MSTNYNELVDYQVSNMQGDLPDWTNNITPPNHMTKVTTSGRQSFDELYEEYSSKSIPQQINNLKELGRDLFNKIDKIVDQIDVILEGIDEEESNNNEEEITVDPLTHKVVYNKQLNEYKVVER